MKYESLNDVANAIFNSNKGTLLRTPSGLAKIAFEFHGRRMEAVEQNRKSNSNWAELARQGHRVVIFYLYKTTAQGKTKPVKVAAAVDGEVRWRAMELERQDEVPAANGNVEISDRNTVVVRDGRKQ